MQPVQLSQTKNSDLAHMCSFIHSKKCVQYYFSLQTHCHSHCEQINADDVTKIGRYAYHGFELEKSVFNSISSSLVLSSICG